MATMPGLWDATMVDDMIMLVADHLAAPLDIETMAEGSLQALRTQYATQSIGAAHWLQLCHALLKHAGRPVALAGIPTRDAYTVMI